MKFFPLIWAGIWRKPGRAILTLLSIANAFLLFGILQGFLGGLSHAKSEANANILLTASRVSTNELLPYALHDRFMRIPGVLGVSPLASFTGYYRQRGNGVRSFAVDLKQIPEPRPALHLTPAQLNAMRTERTAAVVSRDLATRFGWKVGDHIPLNSYAWTNKDGTNTWQLDIVGVYDAPDDVLLRNTLLMSYDYLDQARANDLGTVHAFVTRISNPERASQIAAEMDRMTANSPSETLTLTESQYASNSLRQIGDVGLLVNSVVGAMFFTLLFSVGAVMSQSLRERTKEMAVLKAIGFPDGLVLFLVLAEAVLVCALAAGAGLWVASAVFPAVTRAIGFTFIQRGPLALWGLGAAALLALISGLPPALRAMRLHVVDALAAN